jgi:hypothetical protein
LPQFTALHAANCETIELRGTAFAGSARAGDISYYAPWGNLALFSGSST